VSKFPASPDPHELGTVDVQDEEYMPAGGVVLVVQIPGW
jgi:hypothetical protein